MMRDNPVGVRLRYLPTSPRQGPADHVPTSFLCLASSSDYFGALSFRRSKTLARLISVQTAPSARVTLQPLRPHYFGEVSLPLSRRRTFPDCAASPRMCASFPARDS